MTTDQLKPWVQRAHDAGLLVAAAGRLEADDFMRVASLAWISSKYGGDRVKRVPLERVSKRRSASLPSALCSGKPAATVVNCTSGGSACVKYLVDQRALSFGCLMSRGEIGGPATAANHAAMLSLVTAHSTSNGSCASSQRRGEDGNASTRSVPP